MKLNKEQIFILQAEKKELEEKLKHLQERIKIIRSSFSLSSLCPIPNQKEYIKQKQIQEIAVGIMDYVKTRKYRNRILGATVFETELCVLMPLDGEKE